VLTTNPIFFYLQVKINHASIGHVVNKWVTLDPLVRNLRQYGTPTLLGLHFLFVNPHCSLLGLICHLLLEGVHHSSLHYPYGLLWCQAVLLCEGAPQLILSLFLLVDIVLLHLLLLMFPGEAAHCSLCLLGVAISVATRKLLMSWLPVLFFSPPPSPLSRSSPWC
jgi:hypothetical protein